jgi:hypothetical protein
LKQGCSMTNFEAMNCCLSFWKWHTFQKNTRTIMLAKRLQNLCITLFSLQLKWLFMQPCILLLVVMKWQWPIISHGLAFMHTLWKASNAYPYCWIWKGWLVVAQLTTWLMGPNEI